MVRRKFGEICSKVKKFSDSHSIKEKKLQNLSIQKPLCKMKILLYLRYYLKPRRKMIFVKENIIIDDATNVFENFDIIFLIYLSKFLFGLTDMARANGKNFKRVSSKKRNRGNLASLIRCREQKQVSYFFLYHRLFCWIYWLAHQ